ncbi:glycoside hydrolase family 3 C-terminal domain-containing protein [Bacteroides sp. 519]|uniref:glycoside hydrolase family 3 C-terminal domain-containing protein n=1 Tax=Bacteroides sp. 519 TaxID=2302937 RepID=UPI0013D4CDC6|nr:glycoside hydrolase family 3 C-terminal domain-containing protein [Bacteroides sp. 519]NDV60326.1 beta-glucosidase [Bacteroides sp. 519]
MKNKTILITLTSALFLTSCAEKVPQLGKAPVDDIIAAMTLDEKVKLLIGTGMAGLTGDSAVVGETKSLVPGAAGTTYPIPRLGIPTIVLADGPAGLRISPTRENDPNTYYCTAFPVGTLLASTWNTELVEQVGQAMGNEVLEYGADVLLAPALNIHRNPLCGRNFEYYSEDPVISGKIAAAMTKGVQSNGVGVSLKHYAANNQETNRMGNDSRVTPRALREIYLKGFEIAVKEADPWTIMSSYNLINGVYASESRDLQTTILRDEWGFKGTVMTDWFGGKNAPAQMHAGNDLLMPGYPQQMTDIVEAVQNGTLSEADINTNVKRVLELVLKSPRFKGYKYSNKPDLDAHAVVTRQSASEGMVLLKNENEALPLSASVRKVAAYGITSYDFIAGGTGSGDVNEAYTVSLVQGLENAGYALNAALKVQYEEYIEAENAKNVPDPNDKYAMFMPKVRPGEFVPTATELNKQAQSADVALITIGRTSGEFLDRKLTGDFELTNEEQELIATVSKAFQSLGKKAIVILNIGGVIETASWKNTPDAILLAWQAGQEGGNTVADALSGKVNPSGKLTMTFPVKFMDAASSANFPVDSVRNIDYTIYEEDIYVGYRYFDTYKKDVSYPFGYGLSYTTFEYSNAQLKNAADVFTVTIDVKNTGKISGKEVVQLYASAPAGALGKPMQELKAFAKTKELKPGESETITLTVDYTDLASYDESKSAWVTDSGTYKLLVAASSRNVKATVDAVVAEAKEVKTNDVLKLK